MYNIAENIWKRARIEAGLTQEEAIELLPFSLRRLQYFEAGQGNDPNSFEALSMARVYNSLELICRYRQEVDPIGQQYDYIFLDNVNTDPISVLAKLQGELKETDDIYIKLMTLAVNKRSIEDYSKDELLILDEYIQELLDIEHNIQVLKLALSKQFDISVYIQEHNKKCIDHGYVRKEKPVCQNRREREVA